jgi:hypothetical protein
MTSTTESVASHQTRCYQEFERIANNEYKKKLEVYYCQCDVGAECMAANVLRRLSQTQILSRSNLSTSRSQLFTLLVTPLRNWR